MRYQALFSYSVCWKLSRHSVFARQRPELPLLVDSAASTTQTGEETIANISESHHALGCVMVLDWMAARSAHFFMQLASPLAL